MRGQQEECKFLGRAINVYHEVLIDAPVRHLRTLLGVVVGSVGGSSERRATVVALVDPQRVLPHVFRFQHRDHLTDHSIHVVDHTVVSLAMVFIVFRCARLNEVEVLPSDVRDLQWFVHDVASVAKEEWHVEVHGVVILDDFEYLFRRTMLTINRANKQLQIQTGHDTHGQDTHSADSVRGS